MLNTYKISLLYHKYNLKMRGTGPRVLKLSGMRPAKPKELPTPALDTSFDFRSHKNNNNFQALFHSSHVLNAPVDIIITFEEFIP